MNDDVRNKVSRLGGGGAVWLKRLLGLGLIVFGIFIFATLSVRIVDQGETCAVIRLGRVVGSAEPGLHFVVPFVTNYDCYTSQHTLYQTAAGAVGNADFLDVPVEIKTGDGQTAEVLANTVFRIPPDNVIYIRTEIGNNMDEVVKRVVANYARSVPRGLAPNYTATQLYSVGRNEYSNAIMEEMARVFEANGVELVSFEIRDINFDPTYEQTIEDQQIARERIEKAQFEAQSAVYEAQRVAELAKGDAQATIERARGAAEAQKISAAAEAEAIRLRGQALEENPSVLQLEFVQQLGTSNWMMVPWDQVQGFLPLQTPGTPVTVP